MYDMDAETKELRSRIVNAFYLNLFVVIIIIVVIICFNDTSTSYMKVGYNDNLIILGIKIHTFERYIGLLVAITAMDACDTYVSDLIFPYINNNVRDNNVKHIREFTRFETQILTNTTFLSFSIRYALFYVVSITQIDIALYRVFVCEATCIYTTYIQLKDKTFMNDTPIYQEVSQFEIV
jgi:hypothetical protein